MESFNVPHILCNNFSLPRTLGLKKKRIRKCFAIRRIVFFESNKLLGGCQEISLFGEREILFLRFLYPCFIANKLLSIIYSTRSKKKYFFFTGGKKDNLCIVFIIKKLTSVYV